MPNFNFRKLGTKITRSSQNIVVHQTGTRHIKFRPHSENNSQFYILRKILVGKIDAPTDSPSFKYSERKILISIHNMVEVHFKFRRSEVYEHLYLCFIEGGALTRKGEPDKQNMNVGASNNKQKY